MNKSAKKKGREMDFEEEIDVDEIKRLLIDLFLSVKVRSKEEVS